MPKTKASSSKKSRTAKKPRNSILAKRFDEDTREARLYAENQTQSPLLRLPAELRMLIYEFTLGGKCIYIEFQTPDRKGATDQRTHNKSGTQTVRGGFHCNAYDLDTMPLTFRSAFKGSSAAPKAGGGTGGFTLLGPVCRQLYHETAALPFKLNTIAFQNNAVLTRYLWKEKRLPLFQRRAIRTLFLQNWPTETMRRYLGGLRILKIDDRAWVNEYDLKKEVGRRITKSQDEMLRPTRNVPWIPCLYATEHRRPVY